MGEQLPIIYVRGFAGGQSGIDKAVDDPFYGFNEGSTHIRVGTEGKPQFYQFESMLLRLMEDHQYGLPGDRDSRPYPAKSVWIFRFYDKNASTFGGKSTPYRIEDAAKDLGTFIDDVLAQTEDADRVFLVAHSMGGLICRSMLQRSSEHVALVAKLVTIGTPHGGIDPKLGGGIGDWVIDTFGPRGSDIFGQQRMRKYLLPDGHEVDDDWDPRVMVGDFPPEDVLSIVGTNARDYEAAHGWSSRVMGEQSDGLVAIDNAYVNMKKSPRAYVHRSHSGRYGLVNSEEAYQNLRRFLFGVLRVDTELTGLALDADDGRAWQADVWLAIRGLPVLMHEQTAAHHCPVNLLAETEDAGSVPLVTAFLLEPPEDKQAARYALNIRVIALDESGGIFGFGDHLEQIADWEDTLIVDIVADKSAPSVEAGCAWNSSVPGRIADAGTGPLEWADGGGVWTADVPLPPLGKDLLGAGAALTFTASLWD